MESLERLRLICGALPEHEETPGPHAAFKVRGKVFAYHQVNHHGDRMVTLVVKAGPGVQGGLIESDPRRFLSPQFMGHLGWVSCRLDLLPIDWDQVASLVEESYRLTAPKKVAAAIDRMAIGAALDAIDRLPPMRPVDPSIWNLSDEAQALRGLFLAHPEVEEKEAWGRPTFRVAGKMFGYLHDREAGKGCELWLRSTHEATALLVDQAADAYFVPPYEGTRGWVAVRVDHAGLERSGELIRDAWRLAAPKRLLKP
ncbi:MAG: MmcQ/YjbR family DNA-binding protein [Dehalococcoidia bacterium]